MSEFVTMMRRHRDVILVLLSGFLVPLLTNLVSEWLVVTTGTGPSRLLQIISFGVGGMLALVALYLALRRGKPLELVPREERPEAFPGLIVLVGPGPKESRSRRDFLSRSAAKAIEYHLQPGKDGRQLQVCWLITSAGETGGLPVAEHLRTAYADKCEIIVRTVGNAFGVQETYQVVKRERASE